MNSRRYTTLKCIIIGSDNNNTRDRLRYFTRSVGGGRIYKNLFNLPGTRWIPCAVQCNSRVSVHRLRGRVLYKILLYKNHTVHGKVKVKRNSVILLYVNNIIRCCGKRVQQWGWRWTTCRSRLRRRHLDRFSTVCAVRFSRRFEFWACVRTREIETVIRYCY